MRFILCDSETVNSYGFKTDVEGIDLSRFEKNPVMLYEHDREKVIGRWEDPQVIETQTGHTVLTAEAVFDTDDPFAAEVKRKVEQEFIRGCSMGIVVRQITTTKGIDTATESTLIEASIVTIPADENALVVYDSEDKQNKLSINEFNKLFYTMDKKKEPTEMELQLSNKNIELQATIDKQTATIADLSAQIDELKRDLAERDYREAEAFVDKAIADGKITEEVKGEALSFYLSFPKETEKLFASIKGIADEPSALQRQTLSEMVNQKAEPSQTWDELDRAGKLRNLKANNPEEFKRLYKEKFHKEWE